ncbi:Hypothetical_protein [Hexamita inflata]|uniref:Hypothetical_protein n=1 Tax=Hexamita inflata TaxID=28002 RepID=A0ABP1GDW8_9EUKA
MIEQKLSSSAGKLFGSASMIGLNTSAFPSTISSFGPCSSEKAQVQFKNKALGFDSSRTQAHLLFRNQTTQHKSDINLNNQLKMIEKNMNLFEKQNQKWSCQLQTMENLRKVSFRLQYTLKTPGPSNLSVMHPNFGKYDMNIPDTETPMDEVE